MKVFIKTTILFAVLFFTPCYFAFASLEINEIMYDLKTGSDDGREWVEIYNNSDASIDMSSVLFFEAETNHKLKLVQGDAKIQPRGYVLIISDPVKFKADWPNLFSGSVFVSIFDSSFSLSNDSELLVIKSEDNKNENIIIDQYTYRSISGASGDDKSLQKINGVWLPVMPTPGTENKLEKKPDNKVAKVAVIKAPTEPKKQNKITIEETKEIRNEPEIPAGDLGAQVIDSVTEENSNNSYIFMIILILLIGASAGAVYFIRRNKVISTNSRAGDDFRILDE